MIKLDAFQEEAIRYIKEGYSVIVSAPTGAGKTLIAEKVIEESIKEGKGVIYTAPIKALSNQKFRDFSSLFPGKVGIITGDVSVNSQNPVLIMTTEIFRNYILEKEEKLEDKSWVIFDEIHYLDDVERGTVWEESLILLPSHMRFLALSATIPNIDSLTRWLEEIHPFPVKKVVEKERPVPLRMYFQYQNQIIRSLKKLEKLLFRYDPWSRIKPNRIKDLVKHLKENDRLPAIYFVFSRKKCEELAWEMIGEDFLNFKEKEKVLSNFRELIIKLGLENERWSSEVEPLIERGIAYHHAGMLPMAKEVIERLFTQGLIKLIFTTETFALGINMPARSVCFDDLIKTTGKGKRLLKVREFYQMAGRAGRRGIDEEGFVYLRINPHHLNPWEVRKIIYGKPEPVRSQFNASYGTILNLYKRLREGLVEIYPLSFHFYQQRKRGRKRGEELIQNKLKLLKDLGYITSTGLSLKGEFSSHLFGYELIFGELFEEGFLDKLPPFELASLVCGVVSEVRRGMKLPPLPPRIKGIKNKLEILVEFLRRKERKYKVYPLTKKPQFHLVPGLLVWMKEGNFEKAQKLTKMDEGEIIRNFRLCIQVLRNISEGMASSELRGNAKKALEMIKCGIVDAEKELMLELGRGGEENA